MATIKIESFLEQRDVDAALYLLGRLLGLSDATLGARRQDLAAMKKNLEHSRHITPDQRHAIVSSYRAVVG